MGESVFFPADSSPALAAAARALEERGCRVAPGPGPEVTHLLLEVPSFQADGNLKGGGALEPILMELPENVTVLGGNLDHPALAGRKTIDFLKDEAYLAENAAITAHCAVKLALAKLPVIFTGCPVLVIGWGRIGKCLASLLKSMGARVDVAARKPADRAMLYALGYGAVDTAALGGNLLRYRAVFNTVPAPVISQEQRVFCRRDCLLIDLASVKGIDGPEVLWARGLPGKDAPESSGRLIARTAIRLAGRG